MTSIIDVWRAIDPAARLVSGDAARLTRPVLGVARTRAAPPHLPASAEGMLLVVDGRIAGTDLAALVATLREAELAPAALLIAQAEALDAIDEPMPVIASLASATQLHAAAEAYLADEPGALGRLSTELRLACAEAALADPSPSAPAGLVASRLRRGVAITVDGDLRAVHPRPAGRMLAARFSALHVRLLAAAPGGRADLSRRSREGLWLVERQVLAGASVALFDDLPFAAVDLVAADALRLTLRALLRRPSAAAAPPASTRALAPPPGRATDALHETLLAVARANGRVAPAARQLGVHRNTVLYRLRQARAELGVDPRRSEDALRLLREAEDGARRRS